MRRESSVIGPEVLLKARVLKRVRRKPILRRLACYRENLEGDGARGLGLRGFIRLSKPTNRGWERK